MRDEGRRYRGLWEEKREERMERLKDRKKDTNIDIEMKRE